MNTPIKNPQVFFLLTSLYIAQGIPFGLQSQALPALLREYDVSLKWIGLTALLALPWALKFIWAPWVDRLAFKKWGRRRSWIVPLQCLNVITLGVIAFNAGSEPSALLTLLMVSLLLMNLAAATQDIATDGLAVQILSSEQRGIGNSIQVAAYRVGMIIGGGVLLIWVSRYGWHVAFYGLAAIMLVSTFPIARYREPEAPLSYEHQGIAVYLSFFKRPGIAIWLLVLLTYKLGDSMGSIMLRPMLIDKGMTLEQIGWLTGVLASIASIVGAVTGGLLIARLGRMRALTSYAILQALSFVGFMVLAEMDLTLSLTATFVAYEQFTGGMTAVALFTLMMDQCRSDYAGSDYSVQASVQVVAGGLIAAASGFLASALGYGALFGLAFVCGVLVLLPVYAYRHEASK